MDIRKMLAWALFISSSIDQAAPMVEKIVNKSQVGFIVVLHSDASSCSLSAKNILIDAHAVLVEDFLLEPSLKLEKASLADDSVRKLANSYDLKKTEKASLILRPAYYYNESTQQQMSLLNDENLFDDEKVEKAYIAWKNSGKKRKFNDAQHWLDRWVGKDIMVVPDALEATGYIMHLVRIRISNQARDHGQWLSKAKGVFSRLIVEIEIDQHDRRGIIPSLKVSTGEGGICTGGVVDRI